MKLLHVEQGTPRWLEIRKDYLCASEAPAMLGLSKFMSRDELLYLKKTGNYKDAKYTKHFELGNASEELARRYVSTKYNVELFNATGISEVEGMDFLSSFDGMTIDGSLYWENKLYSNDLNYYMMTNFDVPNQYWPQLEHQLLTCSGEFITFTASDLTNGRSLYVEHTYLPQRERTEMVIEGWKLFLSDLKEYKRRTIVEMGATNAPSIIRRQTSIDAAGYVDGKAANEIVEVVDAFCDSVNMSPETDDEFSAAIAVTKSCVEAESEIKDHVDAVIGKISYLREFMDSLDSAKNRLARIRIDLSKMVKEKKEKNRHKAISDAVSTYVEKTEGCTKEEAKAVETLLASAVKGKKTKKGMMDACDSVVTQAVIAKKLDPQKINILSDKDAMDALRSIKEKGYLIDEVVAAYNSLD